MPVSLDTCIMNMYESMAEEMIDEIRQTYHYQFDAESYLMPYVFGSADELIDLNKTFNVECCLDDAFRAVLLGEQPQFDSHIYYHPIYSFTYYSVYQTVSKQLTDGARRQGLIIDYQKLYKGSRHKLGYLAEDVYNCIKDYLTNL